MVTNPGVWILGKEVISLPPGEVAVLAAEIFCETFIDNLYH